MIDGRRTVLFGAFPERPSRSGLLGVPGLGGVLAVPAAGRLLILVTDGAESRIRLVGDLDVTTAADLRQAVQNLLTPPTCDVLMDLSDLRFCDVAGVRTLVWSTHLVAEHGHRMRVTGARPSIRETLAITYGDKLVMAEIPDEPP